MIVSGRPPAGDVRPLRLEATSTAVARSGVDAMAWTIGDHGFDMTLTAYVPRALELETAGAIAPLLEAIHERMTPVTIEKLTWSDCVEKYDLATTLFYLDPPYYGCEGDYGADLFDRSQFAKMAQQLATIEGKFLLSLNDRPEVRSLFSAFSMYEVSLIYSIGGGDKSVQASELIISNLPQSELDRVMAD